MLVTIIDELVGRIADLANYRYKVRGALLQDHITPIYNEFELLHKEYLVSFEKYRELIQSSKYPLDDNNPIFDIIKTDNLFSMHMRINIIERSRVVKISELSRLVNFSEMSKVLNNRPEKDFIYLITRYLVDAKRVIDEPYHSQIWRRSLLYELAESFAIDKPSHINPYEETVYSKLLSDKLPDNTEPDNICDNYAIYTEDRLKSEKAELDIATQKELDNLCNKYTIDTADPLKIEKLKVILAIQSLDKIVEEMQFSYQKVTREYYKLKANMSGSFSLIIDL